MINKNFKVGDWCFSNFQLCQIKEIKDSRITSVTDGAIERSGNDLMYSCFPLDMRIKRISDSVLFWYNKLHGLKAINLNYPDIVRSLEQRWIEMCENKDDDKMVKDLYEKLSTFAQSIIRRVDDLRYEKIDGVSLVRR